MPRQTRSAASKGAEATPPTIKSSTPAKKTSKRKAPQEDTIESTSTSLPSSSKKPKVLAIHTTEATVTAPTGEAHHLKHTDAALSLPLAQTTPIAATAAKSKRIVFDDNDTEPADDGPSEFFTPQGGSPTNNLQPQNDDEEEKSEDDDDDAPEAISTSVSAAQAARASQAAVRAAEKQEAEQRQKRQARDARLKAQTEARRKEQLQKQNEKKKLQKDDDDEDEQPAVVQRAPNRRRQALPTVLPEDFLVSDSETSDGEEDEEQRVPKKIKFNTVARQVEAAEKGAVRDVAVGGTVYRVTAKQGDGKLAPKGRKVSKNARERLLGRGRVAVAGKGKKGFLVKR